MSGLSAQHAVAPYMKVEHTVEILCEKGCSAVRETIEKLESGIALAETRDLTHSERLQVIKELKSIMAVYGDSCRVTF